jgi:hypothetical protein
MGLAGLLVATAPSVLTMGGLAAAPTSGEVPVAASAAPSGAPATESLSVAAPSPADDGGVFQGSDNGDGAATRTAPPDAVGEPDDRLAIDVRDDATGLSALAVLGGTLTILGLALFLLRWSARRFS